MPKITDRLAPDWAYWLNMASVSLDDAVYLSLQIDPRIKKDRKFSQARGITKEDASQLKGREKPFIDRFKQAESAVIQRTLASNCSNIPVPLNRSLIKVTLANFVSWVAGLTNPWDLSKELSSPHAPGLKTKEDPREIASFERMLLAIALARFSFDPFAKRNGTAKDIHLETKKFGLEVSESNIRQKLADLSAKYIDENVKEKIERNRLVKQSSAGKSKTTKR
jgi:hypothetical protein